MPDANRRHGTQHDSSRDHVLISNLDMGMGMDSMCSQRTALGRS